MIFTVTDLAFVAGICLAMGAVLGLTALSVYEKVTERV